MEQLQDFSPEPRGRADRCRTPREHAWTCLDMPGLAWTCKNHLYRRRSCWAPGERRPLLSWLCENHPYRLRSYNWRHRRVPGVHLSVNTRALSRTTLLDLNFSAKVKLINPQHLTLCRCVSPPPAIPSLPFTHCSLLLVLNSNFNFNLKMLQFWSVLLGLN